MFHDYIFGRLLRVSSLGVITWRAPATTLAVVAPHQSIIDSYFRTSTRLVPGLSNTGTPFAAPSSSDQ